MQLRPYQEKGEEEIFQQWENHLSLMFQMATGGGKTVIFVDVVKTFLKRGLRIILIAHREELITQAWRTLYDNRIYSGIIKSGMPANPSLPCQVASIQTIIRKQELPEADLIIFDEAHHCQMDNSYGQLLKSYPDAKVLGVTATPYRLSGHGFSTFFNTLITSANYSDLRDDGYLVPYKYLIGSFPDMSEAKLSRGDYKDSDSVKAMGMAPLVQSYKQHCGGKKGVVFAVNVAHSIKVTGEYNDGGIPAAHLDGNTPGDERKDILQRFKSGDILIIVNVGIITEGFDFPDMDFVQLARPTKSLSMFLQMVGRCFRVHDDTIKGIDTAEQRCEAIANSEKPFAFILDNAGCWEEHGLPDQEFDWQMYFEGISNKRMKEAVEYIELIEYVAEDENGNIVKSKNPIEIEGMVLIEVNKQIRERVLNVTSIKQFDRFYDQHKYIKNIKKKGWTTFFKFHGYCKKHFIDMGEETWIYITKKLCTEPKEIIDAADRYREKTISGIMETYRNNPLEQRNLIAGLERQHHTRTKTAIAYYIPKSALMSKKREYDVEKMQKPRIPVKL